MAELKEGQQIIFRHPVNNQIQTGRIEGEWVLFYEPEWPVAGIPINKIKEWCDAEAAWNALTLQEVRAGNFEWNEGPTDEPETI